YLVPRRQESGVGDRGAEEVAGVLALASGPVGHTVKLRRRAGTTKTRRYEDAAGLVDEKSRRKYKRPDFSSLVFSTGFFRPRDGWLRQPSSRSPLRPVRSLRLNRAAS